MRRPLSLESIQSAVTACAVLVLTAFVMAGESAAAPATDPNETCLACHGDKDAKSAGGKSIAVEGAAFAKSVHGEMKLECTACHTDVSAKTLPHAEKLKPVDCGSCHEKPVREYAATLHGVARKAGSAVAATCADCHGTHDILKTGNPASRTNHANLEQTCAACHGNEALIKRANLPGGNIASRYHDSIHGQAIANKTSAKDAAPSCTNCHGAHDMRAKTDPASRVTRANIPGTCGSCHMNVKAAWEKSHHGQLRQANVLQAPGCTDCHSAHDIKQHNAPEWVLAVVQQCGSCHNDYIASYRDTFHGQVNELGYTQVATCASCHGSHEILPASNPVSKVSAQNRLATCRTCHPKANVNFALYDPHANRHRRDGGELLFFTGKFMDFLLIGVFGFFGAHTGLWFFRSWKVTRERRAKTKDSGHKEN